MEGGKDKKPLPENQKKASRMEYKDTELPDPASAEARCQLTFLPCIVTRFFLDFGFLCVSHL